MPGYPCCCAVEPGLEPPNPDFPFCGGCDPNLIETITADVGGDYQNNSCGADPGCAGIPRYMALTARWLCEWRGTYFFNCEVTNGTCLQASFGITVNFQTSTTGFCQIKAALFTAVYNDTDPEDPGCSGSGGRQQNYSKLYDAGSLIGTHILAYQSLDTWGRQPCRNFPGTVALTITGAP